MKSVISNTPPLNHYYLHVRLYNPNTRKYLHQSGKGETKKFWAWRGLRKQAQILKERAKIQGEDWPYKYEPVENPK